MNLRVFVMQWWQALSTQANRVCSVSHEVHKRVTVDPIVRRSGLPQALMSLSVFLS